MEEARASCFIKVTGCPIRWVTLRPFSKYPNRSDQPGLHSFTWGTCSSPFQPSSSYTCLRSRNWSNPESAGLQNLPACGFLPWDVWLLLAWSRTRLSFKAQFSPAFSSPSSLKPLLSRRNWNWLLPPRDSPPGVCHSELPSGKACVCPSCCMGCKLVRARPVFFLYLCICFILRYASHAVCPLHLYMLYI